MVGVKLLGLEEYRVQKVWEGLEEAVIRPPRDGQVTQSAHSDHGMHLEPHNTPTSLEMIGTVSSSASLPG